MTLSQGSAIVLGMESTQTFADVEAVLANVLIGYESRPQQQKLAVSIEGALQSGEHLLAEAGCGTGKSLGYLIPAILSGKRVVIATATKALQDQLADKDLPFLKLFFNEHLGQDFTYAILKGRGNYVCRSKVADADPLDVPSLARILAELDSSEPTFVGDRSQFTFEIPKAEWSRVTTGAEECPGKKECPFGDTCLSEKAKKLAKNAQIVVVNHSLLFTDLVIRHRTGGVVSMLDEYDVVIFDEAHEAEGFASSVFGDDFSEGAIKGLSAEVRNYVRRHDAKNAAGVEDILSNLSGALTGLWTVLKPGEIRQAEINEFSEEFISLYERLADLAQAVIDIDLSLVSPAEYPKVKGRKERLVKRSVTLAENFSKLIVTPHTEVVRWVEEQHSDKWGIKKVIKTEPVDVSTILRPLLFETTPTILVSATLEVNGGFNFIASRLGIDAYSSLNVGTPFDFESQSLFYVPTDIPDPSPKTRAAWESLSIARTAELVKASNGRALLLFTSRKQMNAAWDFLSGTLPYTCLRQGDAPNGKLAEQFLADTHSVLFATRSFFTGVDFQGEACSLVVIDKLPFPRPDEPITRARQDAVEAAGGNSFSDYVIPLMTLILKHGHGRLIRHRNDKGVFALLDPRIKSKGYGSKIRRSLPESKFTTDVADVRAFFGGDDGLG